MIQRARELYQRVRQFKDYKGDAELRYWRSRHQAEHGSLSYDHYMWFYTGEFGLVPDDYDGKRVLDIGCGPRGSLEWATTARERIGLDPLVDQYRQLGIDSHAMTYVSSGAETIPFDDGHFDIVTTFNSLDHVDDVPAAIQEMTRVARPGGIGLVIVEVNHPATATEPHTLPWNLFDQFCGWTVEQEKRTAINADHNVYGSFREGARWIDGPGILGGRLRRTVS
jgi:SAM-dependent methyltransferase